jgi:hypothetical protein
VQGDRDGDDRTDELVELGQWPRLDAQILRHRLESAEIPVMVRWSGEGLRAGGRLFVPAGQAEFARAVVTEIEVDDEVPDTSPFAYITRIEEHLGAVAGLLDELRARFEQEGEDGRAD